ncbi:MAG: 4Fe-4S dicluster domain-containing protein [Caldilinea sp.]|nr:4Fe-4S dicluster domain-containing protein [Caldilinea sp.]
MADYEQLDTPSVVLRADLQRLFDSLHARGYETIAPRVENGAIIYDEVTSVDALPAGWTDEQEGGFYRLERRDDGALFGYTVGPQSWKRYLSPPIRRLWQARKNGDGFEIVHEDAPTPHYALIGVRACELHAIHHLDDVYLGGSTIDADYQQRREAAFIVAVNCGKAGNTCFCASLGTGPAVGPGYDLALTELVTEREHAFVVTVGSERGADVLADVPHRPAAPGEIDLAEAIVAEAARHMGRTLETTGLKELLYRSFEHPHWDEVAERCLTCGNCTMVCPTCFCFTVEDTTDLTGQSAERWRRADSCFTTAFTFITSGSQRASAKARYRQWLTHKLATWQDQFGSLGCVGCGRCITWCPVGIDLTAEVAALRAEEIGQPQPEAVLEMA